MHINVTGQRETERELEAALIAKGMEPGAAREAALAAFPWILERAHLDGTSSVKVVSVFRRTASGEWINV